MKCLALDSVVPSEMLPVGQQVWVMSGKVGLFDCGCYDWHVFQHCLITGCSLLRSNFMAQLSRMAGGVELS